MQRRKHVCRAQRLRYAFQGPKSVTYRLGEVPGFGEREWTLLIEILFLGGDVLDLETKRCHVHQRVRRLRRFFGDSKRRERFFVTTTKPYGKCVGQGRRRERQA